MILHKKIKPFLYLLALLLVMTGCGSTSADFAETDTPVSAPGSKSEADTVDESASTEKNGQSISNHAVSDFAGSEDSGVSDGSNTTAEFIKPYGLCNGPDGSLVIIDCYANLIRSSTQTDTSTLAGNADTLNEIGYPLGDYLDGPANEALLNLPRFAAYSADGSIVFTDTGNHCIRILKDGVVRLFAGTKISGYKDGSYSTACFDTPSGIAIGADGTVYIADTLNHCIRSISPEGEVSTLAGTPKTAGYKDGPLAEALFCEPNDIELGPDGALYVVDKGNQRIRRITTKSVETVAGSGTETDPLTGYMIGGYTDGAALESQFQYPTGLSVSPDGTIYVADTGNHCIRLISPEGFTETIAGTKMSGNKNGSLKNARFNQPIDVLYSPDGLYISDSYNHAIRFITFSDQEGVDPS